MTTSATLGQRCDDSDTGTTDQVEVTPPTNPIYPNHGTQAARFLAAMLAGRSINPLDAWQEFGIYRVSDVVLRLRKSGWHIITDELPVVNTFREKCLVGLYRLDQATIDSAGAEGQRFVNDEREVLREMRRRAA